jgi:hypothetical protein
LTTRPPNRPWIGSPMQAMSARRARGSSARWFEYVCNGSRYARVECYARDETIERFVRNV